MGVIWSIRLRTALWTSSKTESWFGKAWKTTGEDMSNILIIDLERNCFPHDVFFLLKKSSTPEATFGPRIGFSSLSPARESFLIVSILFRSCLDFFSPSPGTLQTASRISLCMDVLVVFLGENSNGLLLVSAIWNCWRIWPTWSTSVIGKMMWPLLITISFWNTAKYCKVKSFFKKIKTQLMVLLPNLNSEILSNLGFILSRPLTMSGTSCKKLDQFMVKWKQA